MWPSNVKKTTTNKPKPKTTLVCLIHTHTYTLCWWKTPTALVVIETHLGTF